jgi:putative NADH-flavin reductase
MHVAIFGATGGTGRLAVERALREGYSVTAFARNPAAVPDSHERLSIVQGDVFDPKSVEEAVKGQDAVLCTIGGHDAIRAMLSGHPRPKGLCAIGTRNILDAMGRWSVSRFICLSSWGVGDSKQRTPFLFIRITFPLIMKEEVSDKEEQEHIIADSPLNWTIVRPSVLTNTPATGTYRVQEKLKFSLRSRISRADVADFLVKQLTDTSFLRRTVEITS